MRKVMEEHNLSNEPILRNEHSQRQLAPAEIIIELRKAFNFDLSEDDWMRLSKHFHVETYYEDEMVFRSGDFNNAMHFLLKGELSLFAGSRETGGEIELAHLVKGDILGESCMTHTPFTLSCRAVQFTEMVGIKADDIKKLVDTDPAMGVKFYQQVLTKVVEKMRNNNLQSLSLAGGAVHDSYIKSND